MLDGSLKESLRKTFCGIIRPYQAGPWEIAQQAIAAVENALVDLKTRSLGVPVYELLGGAVREELPLYWSLWKLQVAHYRGDARCSTADLP